MRTLAAKDQEGKKLKKYCLSKSEQTVDRPAEVDDRPMGQAWQA